MSTVDTFMTVHEINRHQSDQCRSTINCVVLLFVQSYSDEGQRIVAETSVILFELLHGSTLLITWSKLNRGQPTSGRSTGRDWPNCLTEAKNTAERTSRKGKDWKTVRR